jgi:tetratricopeptide (TPR) repeat protein
MPPTKTGTSAPTRRADDPTRTPTTTAPSDTGETMKAGRWGRYEVLGQLGAGGMGIVFEAHDPTLRRKVALKLLQPKHNEGGGAKRLALEAQAMAKLSHPNVVTVFEIDRVGDQVYVAMELVAGTTLRGWLRESPRSWREIVEMFVAAGRGLAAAHAAGLIHRDFKPDNVLLGSDARPRVCDFGLVVGTAGDDDDQLTELEALDANATVRGSAVGTPAYMSAEQWAGQVVDARSDQFAFCVALWEALCDSRPFAGARPHEVRASVRAGVITEPASRKRVPRWLLAMLRRGLAVDPAARWPDMTTLLDALERRARAGRRWKIAAITAGIAIASAIAASVIASARSAPEPCAPPTERLAAVWGPARGAALRAHLLAVDPAQGATRYGRIADALDAGARGWRDMHVAACRATRVEGRQSDTLLDRRMECLDRWLVELGDTAGVIAQARNPAAVDRAVRAATSMSPLELCADVRALTAAPPPASAADRATAAGIVHRVRELDVAQRAGQLDGLAPKADEVVAAARALGHGPTLVEALVAKVRILNALDNRSTSEPALRELVQVAARAHDDRAEAFAWMNLLVVSSQAKGKTDEALALVPSARAAVLRAGDPADLRAELLYHHAIVLDYGARPKDGLALLQEARQLLEQAGATSPISPLARRYGDVLNEIANSHLRSEDLDDAIAAARTSIERSRAVSGGDSVDEAFSWQVLSVALQRAGRRDESLAAIQEAVRLRESRLGSSVVLALTLVGEASVYDESGRWDRSVELYDRAVKMSRETMGPDDVNLSHGLINRGVALGHLRRFDEAVRDFDEAIALLERTGGNAINLAIAVYNRGDVTARRGRCDVAIADHTRAIELLDKLGAPDFYALLYPLSGKGLCLVRTGKPADAIPVLERALRCKTSGADDFEVARAKGYLGRALVETRRDVAGGLAMVRAARPAVAAAHDGAEELALLDRWLAARAR